VWLEEVCCQSTSVSHEVDAAKVTVPWDRLVDATAGVRSRPAWTWTWTVRRLIVMMVGAGHGQSGMRWYRT